MKKIYAVFMIVAVGLFTLASCRGNDPKPGKVSICGTWEVTEGYITTDGEKTPAHYMEGIQLILNEDGTAIMQDEPCAFIYENDQLTLRWTDEEGEIWDEVLTVKKLTDKELHLYETQSIEELGVTTEIDMFFIRK